MINEDVLGEIYNEINVNLESMGFRRFMFHFREKHSA